MNILQSQLSYLHDYYKRVDKHFLWIKKEKKSNFYFGTEKIITSKKK